MAWTQLFIANQSPARMYDVEALVGRFALIKQRNEETEIRILESIPFIVNLVRDALAAYDIPVIREVTHEDVS